MTNVQKALAIKADRLTKIYGSGNTKVVAMRDASMQVSQGEVVALLGPSGSGKSTFLTAVGLINPPTSGQITISGKLVLDGQRGRQVMELFAKVAHEQGAGVIVVTHDHRSLDIFDTTYEMEDGILTKLETTAMELSK